MPADVAKGPLGDKIISTENHCPGVGAVQKDQVLWWGDKVAPLDWVPGKTSEEVTLGPEG